MLISSAAPLELAFLTLQPYLREGEDTSEARISLISSANVL